MILPPLVFPAQTFIEVCGAHTFFTSERKRVKKRERDIKRCEGEREGGRYRQRERERVRYLYF